MMRRGKCSCILENDRQRKCDLDGVLQLIDYFVAGEVTRSRVPLSLSFSINDKLTISLPFLKLGRPHMTNTFTPKPPQHTFLTAKSL